MKKSKPKVIAVVGPTASGKTSYAVSLAHKFNGEIVSADSRLVYKGFDIGTAKPSLEECEGVPHHMIDIVEPEIDYSAGLFAEEAKKAVDDILSRGKTPIVAGGTGLYFRLLLENYDVPKVPPDYELRENCRLTHTMSFEKCLKNLTLNVQLKLNLMIRKKLSEQLKWRNILKNL